MWYMKVFEGSWKIEPLYADQERLCKSRSRISEAEYKKCSGGKGRIGSKVTMEQIFQPSSLLNVPPVSWLIHGITIETIKILLEDLRQYVIRIHKSSDTAEYKKSGQHVRSMPLYATDPKYYDLAEVIRQADLWTFPKSKHPWYDAPAKVKVKTKNGICHLNIEFTLGWPPHGVYEMLTNPRNALFFRHFGADFSQRLDNKSTKVLKKDGPRQITKVDKILRWKLLGWSGEKMRYMKVFEGSWKIEPLYADQERLCKSRSRISEQEYKKCSRGKGRIGSKVTMEQIFQPSFLLNVPPVSWLIRGITIEFTKILLEDLRQFVISIHKSSDMV
ncbi:unnamed protein product [Microthlaspi erraticum]|uniref:DUF220 domain-containing protein n=1 Tax=Microthlaspi erraticum TaxID=1685480 RepID=A0A6D2JGK8_9BRAS|nr:unnamed protein product [Microthlaspi erraticum]